MEKTKVIEFIQSMGDGGAETLVKDYALLLDKDRFEVTVVVLHDVGDSANIRRLKECGIPIVPLSTQDDFLKRIWRIIFWKNEDSAITSDDVKEKPVLPGESYEQTGFLRRCRNWVRNLYFGLKFLFVLKQTHATVVHAHLDMLGCLQSVSWFLRNVKLFHTCHALPYLVYAGEEGEAARRLIQCNHLQLIALHKNMAEEMDKLFPEQKAVVIRNGINMARFLKPAISRTEMRQRLFISEDVFLVGHIGRFTPEKNHPFLVEVFREIAARRENAFLLMIGAGATAETEAKLKAYGLGERYRILSHRQDIPELLKAMDAFVFPSVFEGFGIALLEAQASGLRCVASNRCPEEVIRRDDCIPLPLEKPEVWAETVLEPQIRRQTARDLSDYDMNREIRRLELLYLGQPDQNEN